MSFICQNFVRLTCSKYVSERVNVYTHLKPLRSMMHSSRLDSFPPSCEQAGITSRGRKSHVDKMYCQCLSGGTDLNRAFTSMPPKFCIHTGRPSLMEKIISAWHIVHGTITPCLSNDSLLKFSRQNLLKIALPYENIKANIRKSFLSLGTYVDYFGFSKLWFTHYLHQEDPNCDKYGQFPLLQQFYATLCNSLS